MWSSPIFIGFLLKRLPKKWWFLAGITFSLLFIPSIFSLYRSPFVYQPNWQLTYGDQAGIDWHDNFNEYNFRRANMGFPFGATRVAFGDFILVPSHFGYDVMDNLGQLSIDDFMIFLGRRLKLVNEDPKLSKFMLGSGWAYTTFNPDDYSKLNSDVTVQRIYMNNEIAFLLVRNQEVKEEMIKDGEDEFWRLRRFMENYPNTLDLVREINTRRYALGKYGGYPTGCEIFISDGQYNRADIEHVFNETQDWSSYDKISFWIYGVNDKRPIRFIINAPNAERMGYWIIIDDFEGWNRFIFSLKQPHMYHASYDLKQVKSIYIQNFASQKGPVRLDKLALIQNPDA